MNSQRFFQQDTYHHLYNRGANGGKIFFDNKDFIFFLKKLKEYKDKHSIQLLCYCLMPNHFHLFVRQTLADKTVGSFIGELINSFTKSINKKYKRSGVLFQGRTKSKIIYDENAFTVVTKYILLNPVRAKLVSNFSEWEYSSASDILNPGEAVLTDLVINKYFNSTGDFKNYLESNEEIEELKKYLK